MYFYHRGRSLNRIERYFYCNKGQKGYAFTEKQLIVAPNTSNLMKQKIKFFIIRSPKVMRAGTGNKIFFYMALFMCDSIILSGRRGEEGSRNPGFSRASFVNGP